MRMHSTNDFVESDVVGYTEQLGQASNYPCPRQAENSLTKYVYSLSILDSFDKLQHLLCKLCTYSGTHTF